MKKALILVVLIALAVPLFAEVISSDDLTGKYGISYEERQKSDYIEKDGHSFRYIGDGKWEVKKLRGSGSNTSGGFEILSFPPPVGGGDIMIDLGIGLRATGVIGQVMAIPPLFLNVQYALPVGVPISVGGGISFGQWKNIILKYLDWGYRSTYITPYVRADWHWGFGVEWLDFYTGLSLGYDIVTVKWDDGSYSYTNRVARSGFYSAFQAGAHFYFSEHIGAVVETGYPYWIKAGLAIKL